MRPTPIELYAIDAMEKRIREVFPHGVNIRYLGENGDGREPPMSWQVIVFYDVNGVSGFKRYTAKGFTLAGALMEAAAHR